MNKINVLTDGKSNSTNNVNLQMSNDISRNKNKRIFTIGTFLITFTSACFQPISINNYNDLPYVVNCECVSNRNFISLDTHNYISKTYNIQNNSIESEEVSKMNIYYKEGLSDNVLSIQKNIRPSFNYSDDTFESDDYIDFAPRKKRTVDIEIKKGSRKAFNYIEEA